MGNLKELARRLLPPQRTSVAPVSGAAETPEAETTASSWMLTYPDGRRMQKNCTLRVTREHVLRKFPEFVDAAPISAADAVRGPADLSGTAAAQQDTAGSPEFRPRLSAEDLADTASGDTPPAVQAYEDVAIARESQDLREHFEERAGILQHDGGLSKAEAETEAVRITSTYARNQGYLWASLRAALASYPVLLSQLPDKAGPVGDLPLGVATLAVLKGRRVVRQGAFTGCMR